jgi:signal transduction histidine kinase
MQPGSPSPPFSCERRDDRTRPPDRLLEELDALASALLQRRDAILDAWRNEGGSSTQPTNSSSLSRIQFNDHIPAVLDCFAHTIQEWPLNVDPLAAQEQTARLCDHGLQRWQQGYQLRELIREWGHLQVSVAMELERYAAEHPSLEPRVMPTARLAWARLCADGVTESASQYWRLHQTESAGHVTDLEKALEAVRAIERTRAEAWRVAAHDLRGSVTVVKGATALLNFDDRPSEPGRAEAAEMLNQSVSSLHEMLTDLLSLARLDAGHEERRISTFDAAALLRDFCSASQRTATDRGLYLKTDGPLELIVQGDKTKVLRIVQNLLQNALKYTEEGGVSVSWGVDTGRDTDRWLFAVQDTGPGIDQNTNAPLAQKLHDATEVAGEARDASTDRRRDVAGAKTVPSAAAPAALVPGEGVGLTIVKRLCELLDAGMELATEPGHGTTFRIMLPRSYEAVSDR